MQLHTYLEHSQLKADKDYVGIVLAAYHNTEAGITEAVVTYLQKYDPKSLICMCAYFNMIVQTKGLDSLLELQNEILRGAGFKNNYSNKVLFHRYNLLKLIDIILKNSKALKGNAEVFGNNYKDTGGFCLALSVLNSFGTEKHDFVKQLIRDNPQYYECNDYIEKIYFNRILKSIIVYCDTYENEEWNQILEHFESKNNLNVKTYIKFISKLWLYMNQEFDPNNISTFYLIKSKFPNYGKIINYLSSGENENNIVRSEGLYSAPLKIINCPLYSLNEETKCILDLKCLIDSSLGLLFLLSNSSKYKVKEFKDKFYSKIVEIKFIEIVKMIFPEAIDTSDKEGYPDSTIEKDSTTILFEFTTSEPAFSTLYSDKIETLIKQYKNILIERSNQSKNKKAKLYQIAKHISKFEKDAVDIYPVLVTDNYIGDYALVDELDNILTNVITNDPELAIFKKYKITILSFDDIFTVWMCLPSEDRSNQLAKELDAWNKENKGDYLFSFSRFLLSKTQNFSPDYLEFFGQKMNEFINRGLIK